MYIYAVKHADFSKVNQVNSDSLLLRFILEGLAAGAFVYAACVQMLSAELKQNCSSHHADSHDRHDNTTEPPSPFQGLMKAAAVTFGVIGFWGLKLATSGHR
ncbi:hypothetical protein OESDEN_12782 [Oesophagostomum dentatum]|uniref:Uncharacterized protein n=1 Tax=Oesophagostomum dentatum TaxID=61180 RepID=A0A0B1SV83_OESDE|nr:hypothetical protein OESDEN_12782 [Oesophagostomum dentatum]